MIIKDNIPIEAGFSHLSGRAALFSPILAQPKRSFGAAFAVYGLIGVVAFAALMLSVLLTDSPSADAFQRAERAVASVSSSPVQIGVLEDSFSNLDKISPASGTAAPPSVAPPQPSSLPGLVVPDMPPPLDASSVKAPSSETPVLPPPAGDQGASEAAGVPLPPGENKDDIYYDSLPLPPTGAMAKAAGPREVSPALEPAQKFVIVKKTEDVGGMEALLVSANRALVLGRYDAALDMFAQMYKKNPRDPRILMGRAVSLQQAGRRESAIAAYDDMLKVDPGNVEAKINKAGLVGVQYPAVALRDLLAMREKFPAHAGLAAQIGLMQARLGNDAEAMQYLGSAASIEPQNPGHVYNMAVIADRMGDEVKAIALYEQALQLDGRDRQGVRVPRDTIYARLSVLREGKE